MFESLQTNPQILRMKKLRKKSIHLIRGENIRISREQCNAKLLSDKDSVIFDNLEKIYDKIFESQSNLIGNVNRNYNTPGESIFSDDYIILESKDVHIRHLCEILEHYNGALDIFDIFISNNLSSANYKIILDKWSDFFSLGVHKPSISTLNAILLELYHVVNIEENPKSNTHDDNITLYHEGLENAFKESQYNSMSNYMDVQSFVNALSTDHVPQMYNFYKPSAPPIDFDDVQEESVIQGDCAYHNPYFDDKTSSHVNIPHTPQIEIKSISEDTIFNCILEAASIYLEKEYNSTPKSQTPNSPSTQKPYLKIIIILLRLISIPKLALKKSASVSEYIYDWSSGDNISMSLIFDYFTLLLDCSKLSYFISTCLLNQFCTANLAESANLFEYSKTFALDSKLSHCTWIDWTPKSAEENVKTTMEKKTGQNPFKQIVSDMVSGADCLTSSVEQDRLCHPKSKSDQYNIEKTELFKSKTEERYNGLLDLVYHIRNHGLCNIIKTSNSPYLEWLMKNADQNSDNIQNSTHYDIIEHCFALAKSAKQRSEFLVDMLHTVETVCDMQIFSKYAKDMSLFDHSVRFVSNLKLLLGLWIQPSSFKDTSHDEYKFWLSERYDSLIDICELDSEECYMRVLEYSKYISLLNAYKVLLYASRISDISKKRILAKMYQKILSTAYRTKYAIDEYLKDERRYSAKFLKILYTLGATATSASDSIRHVVIQQKLYNYDYTCDLNNSNMFDGLKRIWDYKCIVSRITMIESVNPLDHVTKKYEDLFKIIWKSFKGLLDSDYEIVLDWFHNRNTNYQDSSKITSELNFIHISKSFWYGFDQISEDGLISVYRAASSIANIERDVLFPKNQSIVLTFWSLANYLKIGGPPISSRDKLSNYKSLSDTLSLMCAHYLVKSSFIMADGDGWVKAMHYSDRYFDDKYLLKMQTPGMIIHRLFRKTPHPTEFDNEISFEITLPISELQIRSENRSFYNTIIINERNVNDNDNTCCGTLKYGSTRSDGINNITTTFNIRKYAKKVPSIPLFPTLEFDMIYARNIIKINISNLLSLQTYRNIGSNVQDFVNIYNNLTIQHYQSHPIINLNSRTPARIASIEFGEQCIKKYSSDVGRILNRYGLESNLYDGCKIQNCKTLGCAHIQYLADNSILDSCKIYCPITGIYIIANMLGDENSEANIIDKRSDVSYPIDLKIFNSQAMKKLYVFMDSLLGDYKYTRVEPIVCTQVCNNNPTERDIKQVGKVVNITPQPLINTDYKKPYNYLLIGLYFKKRFSSSVVLSKYNAIVSENLLGGVILSNNRDDNTHSLENKSKRPSENNKNIMIKNVGPLNHVKDKKSSEFVKNTIDLALNLLPKIFVDYYQSIIPTTTNTISQIHQSNTFSKIDSNSFIVFKNQSTLLKLLPNEHDIYTLLCLLK